MKKIVILASIVILLLGSYFVFFNNEKRVSENLDNQSALVYDLVANGEVFRAEIADTPDERALGLSGQTGLEDKEVLLFVFDAPDRYGIWMKDMLFSIDVFWLDENGVIVHVVKDMSPDTFPTTFTPSSRSLFVVEAVAGTAEKYNLDVGVRFELPNSI